MYKCMTACSCTDNCDSASRRKSRNAAGSVRSLVPRPIRVEARAFSRPALRPSRVAPLDDVAGRLGVCVAADLAFGTPRPLEQIERRSLSDEATRGIVVVAGVACSRISVGRHLEGR